jgi:hypothetical protein
LGASELADKGNASELADKGNASELADKIKNATNWRIKLKMPRIGG